MTENKQGDSESVLQIVRYAELKPCFDAFIDTHTPGSDKKENFTIIGPGVSENPNQYVHIAEPHGFNIGGARQPPGCTNSQHSHETDEVFFIHKGTWSFDLGEFGDDEQIVLKPGDLISIPTQVFRGFKNIGNDMGYLWAVLGGDDPGRVLWAPQVFDMASDYGLVLLENGNLVDTAKGEEIPAGESAMPATTAAQVAAMKKPTAEQLRACCVIQDEIEPTVPSIGVAKRDMIGPDAKISWQHDFTITGFNMGAGSSLAACHYAGAEVVFVHEGQLVIETPDATLTAGPGDTVTVPKNAERTYSNVSDAGVAFLIVKGHVGV